MFPHSDAAVARIAPDELWLIGPASARAELARRARSYLSGTDPDGVAVDQSDGWMAWTVSGVQAPTLLARLSTIALPPERPAFCQGAVAEVPAKAIGCISSCPDSTATISPRECAMHARIWASASWSHGTSPWNTT